ncbi:hypothetical protein COEREDRAFT_89707 [Coemansia reversa NRRL 1564]|uniref:Uncharacterized protein n=1 Tax=Coemansia reversa (strain ATCC 12441 / NRRL 1564) TaxID=763665 RepID=A0A2G5B2K8_COERN|nr:hypothetical protein COEREDRAFT_89707 [Coemansia reversa NRRL 1564]|eukprot:PIA13250.1 hypothetical protein COEREDRAFT_89707 [Coemansia reversa NRRL 1564]
MASEENKILPEHIRLAGHWVDSTLTHAQSEQFSKIQEQITTATTHSTQTQTSISTIESQYNIASDIIQDERKVINRQLTGAAIQLDKLSQLVDALDKNVIEMEEAMSKAEDAVGMSLGGRLEQLARFFGSSALSNTSGVPYLRQWAPRDSAIPKPINTSHYFNTTDKVDTE